jgi:hypothetical protein
MKASARRDVDPESLALTMNSSPRRCGANASEMPPSSTLSTKPKSGRTDPSRGRAEAGFRHAAPRR